MYRIKLSLPELSSTVKDAGSFELHREHVAMGDMMFQMQQRNDQRFDQIVQKLEQFERKV